MSIGLGVCGLIKGARVTGFAGGARSDDGYAGRANSVRRFVWAAVLGLFMGHSLRILVFFGQVLKSIKGAILFDDANGRFKCPKWLETRQTFAGLRKPYKAAVPSLSWTVPRMIE
jgi:hypothetical protein